MLLAVVIKHTVNTITKFVICGSIKKKSLGSLEKKLVSLETISQPNFYSGLIGNQVTLATGIHSQPYAAVFRQAASTDSLKNLPGSDTL